MTISAQEQVRRLNAGLRRVTSLFSSFFAASFVFLLCFVTEQGDDAFTLAGEALEENSWPLSLPQH